MFQYIHWTLLIVNGNCFQKQTSIKHLFLKYVNLEVCFFYTTEHTIYVDHVQSKTERSNKLKSEFVGHKKVLQDLSKGKNVYVKNLDDNIDDRTLSDAFQRFGDITSAKVCYIYPFCCNCIDIINYNYKTSHSSLSIEFSKNLDIYKKIVLKLKLSQYLLRTKLTVFKIKHLRNWK